MSEMVTPAGLTAYTVPSDFIVHGIVRHEKSGEDQLIQGRSPRPYRRIVGMALPGQDAIWTPQELPEDPANFDANHFYNPNAVQTETVPLAAKQASTVFAIFERFFSEEARSRFPDRRYSCQSLGATVLGLGNSAVPIFPKAISPASKAEALDAGQVGIIGFLDGGEKPIVQHVLIGLGPDQPDSLQIMAEKGHMGIDTLGNQLKYWRKRVGGILAGFHGVADFGLYAVQPPNDAPTELTQPPA